MEQVPHIPHGNLSVEDKLKQLVNHKELQDEIDKLRDELKLLVHDHGNDLRYEFMTEIQTVCDALLQARKKSPLEVFATSDVIVTLVGAAVDLATGAPGGTILSNIVNIAKRIRSLSKDTVAECLQSYLDGLNVRKTLTKSLLDRSDSRPELTE
jgi:hypothetical protein